LAPGRGGRSLCQWFAVTAQRVAAAGLDRAQVPAGGRIGVALQSWTTCCSWTRPAPPGSRIRRSNDQAGSSTSTTSPSRPVARQRGADADPRRSRTKASGVSLVSSTTRFDVRDRQEAHEVRLGILDVMGRPRVADQRHVYGRHRDRAGRPPSCPASYNGSVRDDRERQGLIELSRS
jgi:hypothetical protein